MSYGTKSQTRDRKTNQLLISTETKGNSFLILIYLLLAVVVTIEGVVVVVAMVRTGRIRPSEGDILPVAT